MKLIGLLLSLFCLNGAPQIIVNDNLMIHYDTLYSNNYRFSNALNAESIIKVNHENPTECKRNCAFSKKCVGIYENYDNDYYCNLLSKLGTKAELVNETSNSIVKISHHNYPLGNHSLNGIIWDSHMFEKRNTSENITVYIDLNHNGILEDGEPYQLTKSKEIFSFDNITEGTYLVRQVSPDSCIEIYPGLNGNFELNEDNIKGDGYIDNVIRFKHHGHSNFTYPFGGYTDLPGAIINTNNFNFIIGNNNKSYMSFHPQDSITLTFLDESVLNADGDDIFVRLFKNSSTMANISVSHDDNEFVLLGVLNSSESINMFDLEAIHYDLPVNYVKLDFYGNTIEPLNIINVGVYNHSIYLPPFAYHINIPYKSIILFLNDCHYDYSCDFYCDLNFLDDHHYYSCSDGCYIFDETQNCNCYHQLDFDDDFDYDYERDEHYCMLGCEYNIQKYIFPNYTLISNNEGLSNNLLSKGDVCDVDCIDKLLDKCNLIEECNSFSFNDDNNDYGNLYDNYQHTYKNNSFFIMKNTYFETTSTTTSFTSTTSTSLTSTTTSGTSTTTSGTSTTTSFTSTTTSFTSTTTSFTSTTTSFTSTTTSFTSTTSGTSTTSTSLTSTSTSSTKPCITNISHNCSVVRDNNFDKSSGLSKKNKTTIIIISVLCGILLIIIITMLVIKKITNRNNINNPSFSMTNPVYNTDEHIENNPDLYQDVDTPHNPDLYQDVDTPHNPEYNIDYIEVLENDA
jgi:hypothetical protein